MRPVRSTRKAAFTLLLSASIVALAAAGGPARTRVYTLEPSTHGNPEGVAFDKRTGSFFVGATGDGTIYRGTLDDPTVSEFITGGPGQEAVGMKVFHGMLYVAGGFSGRVVVYDIETRQLVASFEGFGAGMLNDLVVTNHGEVYVTDSFVPTLWHITAAQVAEGGGTPEGIPLDPAVLEWNFNPFAFNLNGIVELHGGRSLIVMQSETGKLFRIDLGAKEGSGAEIHEILVEPLFGDGLLMDKGRLIVVTFAPTFSLTFVHLDHGAEHGTVVDRQTDPTLRGPSTVARAGHSYLVVNADFETCTVPFTVTALPRNDHPDDE